MTKLISKINIDSAVLQRRADQNTDTLSHSLLVSSNVIVPRQDVSLKKVHLRMVFALSTKSAAAMDFISQRYNEYKDLDLSSVSTGEYNSYLKEEASSTGNYLKSSNPFSPVSTDMEALSLITTDRTSSFGDGNALAADIIIYDAPIEEIIAHRKDRLALLDLVEIELPNTKEEIQQLSIYAFAYDIRVPLLNRTSAENNFTINTGATKTVSITPLGDKTMFLSPSKDQPLVGMKQLKAPENNPDRDKLKIIEELPSDIAVKTYTSVAQKAQELFTTFQKSKNYEISKIIKKENYFSDLWLARDVHENHKFIFAFDLRSYLAKNSLFPFGIFVLFTIFSYLAPKSYWVGILGFCLFIS